MPSTTPLHLAVQNTGRGGGSEAVARVRQRQIIAALLAAGADPAARDASGHSVYDIVAATLLQPCFEP